MPELPEVETTINGLKAIFIGRKIIRVELRREGLRRPFPKDIGQRLTGTRIVGLRRRAKYGLIYNDRDDVLIFHLGMSGKWRVDIDAPVKHDHMILHMECLDITNHTGDSVPIMRAALNDARRFGSVDLLAKTDILQWEAKLGLGPEPLDNIFHAEYLAKAVARRDAPIKSLLLDQNIVAGLGNIYVCEALFMARINPQRTGRSLSFQEIGDLVKAIKSVLCAAIAAGGSTIKDYRTPSGDLGYFAQSWKVYGREGEICDCGRVLARIAQGGRSTFFCGECQKL